MLLREFFCPQEGGSACLPRGRRGGAGCEHLACSLGKLGKLQKLVLDLRRNSVGPGPQPPAFSSGSSPRMSPVSLSMQR